MNNWHCEKNLIQLMSIDPFAINMDICFNEFISPNKSWDISKINQCLPSHIIVIITGILSPINPLLDEQCCGLQVVVIS